MRGGAVSTVTVSEGFCQGNRISDPSEPFGEEGVVPPGALEFVVVRSLGGVGLDNVQSSGGPRFAAGGPCGYALGLAHHHIAHPVQAVPDAYKSARVEGKTISAKRIGNLPVKAAFGHGFAARALQFGCPSCHVPDGYDVGVSVEQERKKRRSRMRGIADEQALWHFIPGAETSDSISPSATRAACDSIPFWRHWEGR